MEILILSIGFAILWGFVCYKMAEKRGRNNTSGFIWGFLFGVLAIIGYAIIGDNEQKKTERLARIIKMAKE